MADCSVIDKLVGGVWLLTNRADPGRALNVWSAGGRAAQSGDNICLWRRDDTDPAQHWAAERHGEQLLLRPCQSPALSLDRYTGRGLGKGCNAWCYPVGATALLAAEPAADGKHFRLRAAEGDNLYLTANGGCNGTRSGRSSNAPGNVYFRGGVPGDAAQEWLAYPIQAAIAGQRLTLPLPQARLTASYRSSAYRRTYGYSHYGIDLVSTVGNTAIYAGGVGTLLAKGWDKKAGNVVIVRYPMACRHTTGQYEDIIFRYYHLEAINEALPTGENAITPTTVLGRYGGSGMGQMHRWAAHLHLEADTDTRYPCHSPTFAANGDIIRVGTAASCRSALEYLHCGAGQHYSTTGSQYTLPGDRAIPMG